MTERPETEVLPRALSGDFDDRFSAVAFVGGGKMYAVARDRLGSIVDLIVKETPFGCSSTILFVESGSRRFFLLPRHGERKYEVTAPFVNYRANIWALKELGVDRIVAWTGPGAITEDYRIGQFVLPIDVLDLTRHRPSTFFENSGIGILRPSPVFCPTLQSALGEVLGSMELDVGRRAVYAVCEGPRLETPAEIRMLQRLGADLVGMTLAPEAFLARELEMCYHPVAYITAHAGAGDEVDDEERRRLIDEAMNLLPAVTWNLLDRLPTVAYACSCQDAMIRYKQRGLIGDDFREWIE